MNDEKDIRLSQQPNSESIPPTRRFFSISDIDEVSELNKFIQLDQSDLTLSPSSRTSRDDENINHSDVVHHQEHALDDVIHREPETPVSADRRLSLDSKRHARTFGSDPIRSPPRFPVRQTQSQSPPSMRRSLSAARTVRRFFLCNMEIVVGLTMYCSSSSYFPCRCQKMRMLLWSMQTWICLPSMEMLCLSDLTLFSDPFFPFVRCVVFPSSLLSAVSATPPQKKISSKTPFLTLSAVSWPRHVC